MKEKIKNELYETRLLLREVPAVIFALFVISVIAMNLLANKSIDLNWKWFAADCGFMVSWLAFLTNDVITKHFGPKAATKISVIAILINLLICLVFFIASKISGMWGEAYVDGQEELINGALNKTFGGTWYVVLGSTIAFFISAIVNNVLNYLIGKMFKKNPDGFLAYASRTYVSTAIGQFVDNMCFALLVSLVFFGWTMTQVIVCSLFGMVFELICEVIFSPIGFRLCKNWKKTNVGSNYLNYVEGKKNI